MLKKLRHTIIFICSIFVFLSCAGEEIDSQKPLENFITQPATSGTKVLNELFFVGKYGKRTGVYKYDFDKKRHKIFWGTFKETVIKLSYSDNLEHLFFLTAKRIGMRRGLSSIRNVKLYRIDLDNLSAEFVSEIGDAVQLYANWSNNNYKVQFTTFDLKYTSQINKYSRIYSQYGKLLKEEMESYNFIDDRYPNFDIPGYPLISPSGNFGIKQLQGALFLNVAGSNQTIFIDSTNNTVSKVGWSDEERFVFIRLKNQSLVNESSTIYIFDIINKNMMQSFISSDIMNFYITKDLLIFDSNVDGKSTIIMFNYRENEFVKEIKLGGNCGLQFIADY